jgi:hypothetical protein
VRQERRPSSLPITLETLGRVSFSLDILRPGKSYFKAMASAFDYTEMLTGHQAALCLKKLNFDDEATVNVLQIDNKEV